MNPSFKLKLIKPNRKKNIQFVKLSITLISMVPEIWLLTKQLNCGNLFESVSSYSYKKTTFVEFFNFSNIVEYKI